MKIIEIGSILLADDEKYVKTANQLISNLQWMKNDLEKQMEYNIQKFKKFKKTKIPFD